MNKPEHLRGERMTDLLVMEEIEQNPEITQRELRRRVGVSLGLTNITIQKMLRKAWIKISTAPGRRIIYALTPGGVREKVRRLKDFVRISFRHYSNLKQSLAREIENTGIRRPKVASYGAGELRELIQESVREAGGTFLGDLLENPQELPPRILVLFQPMPLEPKSKLDMESVVILDFS